MKCYEFEIREGMEKRPRGYLVRDRISAILEVIVVNAFFSLTDASIG
jgi:hypothetical protein